MCGIYFSAKNQDCKCFSNNDCEEKILELLQRRGPNDSKFHTLQWKQWSVVFHGTLLWLRGSSPQVQPFIENGNILLYNGDLFNAYVPPEISDTEYLSNLLSNAKSEQEVIDILARLEGPAAYVFYHKNLNQVWFGRDILGRHSLLIDLKSCHCILTSVALQNSNFVEVDALGIFELALGQSTSLTLSSWLEWKSTENANLPIDQYNVSISSPLRALTEVKCDNANSIADFIKVEKANLDQFEAILLQAVGERIEAQPQTCKNCCLQTKECSHCKLAILFSGGLDSSVLALLAAKYYESKNENVTIDLINVAFQQPDNGYEVPDRITALQAYTELKTVCPSIHFNLLLVNVTKDELRHWREFCIKDLLHPLDTVLDDSIGCAIWFAARGLGELCDGKAYTSPARVLLLGMGADEQLGGYSRQKTAFMNEGREGLLREIQRQIHAISQRNLGRDNRVVAHHAVAGRYPFLDERVVRFLCNLPLEAKMNLSLPRGIGDKIILRALAFSKGLRKTSVEPKRAIQFGSRIAKLENKKEKAADKAVR